MKIGVKTFEYREDFKQLAKDIDFIEIMAIEGKDYSKFKEFNLPILVHAQHEIFLINNANKNLFEKNKSSINFAIKLANLFNSDKIIVHPGLLSDENCSFENAISFFNNFNDKRILIENMPDLKIKKQLCTPVDETKIFLKKVNKGFCLDINHAAIGCLDSRQRYVKKIKDFLKLNPSHYHLGGQRLNNDSHLSIEDSEIDLQGIINLLPENAEITLETTTDLEKIKRDIKLLRGMIVVKNNRK